MSNNSTNFNQTSFNNDLPGLEYFTPTKLFLLIIDLIIIVVSFTGNALVCWIIASNRTMRTTTNILIISLSASDIILTVFNIPLDILIESPLEWPFGEFMCRLVPAIQTSTIYVSAFTMMHIAIYRLWLVRQRTNSKHRGPKSRQKLISTIILTWCASFFLSLPDFFIYKTEIENNLVKCDNIVSEYQYELVLLLFVTQYVVPLAITLGVYVMIGRVIAGYGRTLSNRNSESRSQIKRKRILMLAVVVITFAICWAPFHLYLLFENYAQNLYYAGAIFEVFHVLAISSACYNPVIYFYFNEKYCYHAKKLLDELIGCCNHKCEITTCQDSGSHTLTTQSHSESG